MPQLKFTCPLCGAFKAGLLDHLKDKHGLTGPQASQEVSQAAPAPTPLAPRTPKHLKPQAQRLRCPDCAGWMHLKESRFGLFYGCKNWPGCKGAHGAHPDGKPMGIPADHETRKLRQAAHAALESLWEPGGRQQFPSRGAAYEWVMTAMGMTAEEAHISRFDADQCKKLIEALWVFDDPTAS